MQTASSMAQLTQTVQQNADSAQKANRLAICALRVVYWPACVWSEKATPQAGQ